MSYDDDEGGVDEEFDREHDHEYDDDGDDVDEEFDHEHDQ